MSNLNIGCGLKAPGGWINIDASPSLRISRIYFVRLLLGKRLPPWPYNVRYGDITRRLDIDEKVATGMATETPAADGPFAPLVGL